MKVIISILYTLLLISSALANDGTYLTHGGVIYPTHETKISLEKEELSFNIKNNIAYVNIKFEFNNPENQERKLLIGFQAPSPMGDKIPPHNEYQINNFTIIQNNNILPYTLKVAECENCPLENPKEFEYPTNNNWINVYLFEITFKQGINKINHSYDFPASHNVDIDQFYNYILTKGSKWAGGTINDLTVTFNVGENKFFYVKDIFGPQASWSIIGTGKVTNDKFEYDDVDISYRMVRILNGMLQIEVTNFEPKNNIQFGIVDNYSFTIWPIYYEMYKQDKIVSLANLQIEDDYSKKELRLLRNTIYAQYGYKFNAPDLMEYFNQFSWYIPDPNLKIEEIKLTKEETIFIEKISFLEK